MTSPIWALKTRTMARKRRGLPIDGWLAVDKPIGMSSAHVVAKVLRETGAAKAGHGGTLDPLASGILPIALGEATKTVSYVMDGIKTYRWTVRWGEARSTDDAEGEVIATSDMRPSMDQIVAAIPQFVGSIQQMPPIYSALKVDGARAYDLARQGLDVELAARQVQIKDYRLLGQPDADHAEFETVVGKGTYIRSLARDMAKAVGTVGYVSALRRTSCGPFNEGNAISLETLTGLGHGPTLRGFLLPIKTALDDIPALALNESEARRLRAGQTLVVSSLEDRTFSGQGETILALEGERLVALARIEGGLLRSLRVFNDSNFQLQE